MALFLFLPLYSLHSSPHPLRTHCCARLSAFLNPSWRAYVKNLLNNSRLLAVRRNNLKTLVRLKTRLASLTFSLFQAYLFVVQCVKPPRDERQMLTKIYITTQSWFSPEKSDLSQAFRRYVLYVSCWAMLATAVLLYAPSGLSL